MLGHSSLILSFDNDYGSCPLRVDSHRLQEMGTKENVFFVPMSGLDLIVEIINEQCWGGS
jgi:hypothetical protein